LNRKIVARLCPWRALKWGWKSRMKNNNSKAKQLKDSISTLITNLSMRGVISSINLILKFCQEVIKHLFLTQTPPCLMEVFSEHHLLQIKIKEITF
jgi:hypothetical protein